MNNMNKALTTAVEATKKLKQTIGSLYSEPIANRSVVSLADWPPIADALAALATELPASMATAATALDREIRYSANDIQSILDLYISGQSLKNDEWWKYNINQKLARTKEEIQSECERFEALAVRQLEDMPLLFISHSHEDARIAQRIVELLMIAFDIDQHDIRCTSLAGHKLRAGVQVSEQLRDEVLQAEAVLGILTPRSVKSNYALFELGAAWGAGVRTIPLLAGGTTRKNVPGPLSERHFMVLDKHSELEQLLSELEDVLSVPRTKAQVSGKIEEVLKVAAAPSASVAGPASVPAP